jgi:hypothetical protein
MNLKQQQQQQTNNKQTTTNNNNNNKQQTTTTTNNKQQQTTLTFSRTPAAIATCTTPSTNSQCDLCEAFQRKPTNRQRHLEMCVCVYVCVDCNLVNLA